MKLTFYTSLPLLLLLACIPVAPAAYATETQPASNDSIAAPDEATVTDLSEFVVEGRTQRVVKYGVEYTPDKRTRKMATDATSLLRLMAIPQLEITPGSSDVAMTGGRAVSMFIDYVPASPEELRAIRTEDVMRVEVLQYPEDPRFESAQFVVNFIMHKYAWGGYTMIGGEANAINLENGYGYIYSKYVAGKWTLDANAGASGTHIGRAESDLTETFRHFNIGSHHFDSADRRSYTAGGLSTHNGEWASLRAIFATDKTRLEHTLSFSRSDQPHNDESSEVDYSDGIFPTATARSGESSVSVTPGISAHYLFNLPAQNFITVYWGMSYSHTRRNSSYRLGEMDPIINDNREKVYNPYATVNYSKRFSHNNTFRTALITSNSIYDTRYLGSYDGRQKLLSSENMLFLEYMQNWACGLNLYSRVGMSYVVGRVNGVNTLEQWNPRLGMQLRYYINQRHSASVSAWWGNSHPGPESSNSAMVQSNELLWLMGNPDLRNTLFQQVDLSYNFIPTNAFSLSVYAKYEGNPNKQAYEFMSLPGYDGLVRRMVNSGSCHTWLADVSASLRLLNNSLVLTGGVSAKRVVLTGVDALSVNNLIPRINVNYMTGNFSFGADFGGGAKYVNAWTTGCVYKSPCSYGVNVAYAVGELKVQLSSHNWWNNGRVYTDFDSGRFSSHGWTWQSGNAANIKLNLSYTFTYGKRVSRDNQLGQAGGSGSAILK